MVRVQARSIRPGSVKKGAGKLSTNTLITGEIKLQYVNLLSKDYDCTPFLDVLWSDAMCDVISRITANKQT